MWPLLELVHCFGEQLIAVSGEPIKIDVAAHHRPESPGAGLVAIPIVPICSPGEHAAARMIGCAALVGSPVTVHLAGHDPFQPFDLGLGERVHLADLKQELSRQCEVEVLAIDRLMYFGKVLAAEDGERRRFENALCALEDRHRVQPCSPGAARAPPSR